MGLALVTTSIRLEEHLALGNYRLKHALDELEIGPFELPHVLDVQERVRNLCFGRKLRVSFSFSCFGNSSHYVHRSLVVEAGLPPIDILNGHLGLLWIGG
jgi:hypothetical protein